MVKVTYVFDEATVRRVRQLADRHGRSRSRVVRDAIAEYAARADRLGEAERLRLLDALHRLRDTPVTRSAAEADAELRAIRTLRRRAGRRTAT